MPAAVLPAPLVGRVALALALLGLGACVPLPLHYAAAVSGRVSDAETGGPVAGAIVVLRYDARYHELLPDRNLLGFVEAATDEEGRFRARALVAPGLWAWPLERTESRVVGVIAAGYRCPRPLAIRTRGPLLLSLDAASDLEERRESCRPVAAARGETPRYAAAWRALHARPDLRRDPGDRRVDRLLAARSAFGFGENCEGPALDLALSPGGERVAVLLGEAGGASVEVLELGRAGAAPTRVPLSADAVRPAHGPRAQRRLAWTAAEELVLWEPTGAVDRSRSLSIFASAPPEVVWRAGSAAAAPAQRSVEPPPGTPPARPAATSTPRQPLDPADLHDEADARWLGRSFALRRTPDPVSGLAIEHLHVSPEDGQAYAIELPGEACGPRGRFGHPQYRIAVGGHRALDLRQVDGGCHAVAIDLESGDWGLLESSEAPGVCREMRRVPASLMRTALRGYHEEVEQALAAAGGDPSSAYSLRIAADGTSFAVTRDFEGAPLTVRAPRFPVRTPLRRIDVSVVGGGAQPGGARPVPAARRFEPL